MLIREKHVSMVLGVHKILSKRIDYWCDVGSSFDEQVTLSANLSSEDVVIAISSSGQTKDIVNSTS